MNLAGALVEIGDLDGEQGERGSVIARADGTVVTVKGLTEDEVRTVARHLFTDVQLAVAGAPP